MLRTEQQAQLKTRPFSRTFGTTNAHRIEQHFAGEFHRARVRVMLQSAGQM